MGGLDALRALLAACAALVLWAAATPIASPAVWRPPRAVVLSIVGTNDLHGGVVARDGRGGMELLGGYVKNLRAARARDGGAVLLIDAGDMFQGTLESNLSEGAPVVAAYNALGYTAAAIGNHEFDFGPSGARVIPAGPEDDPRGALKARASEAAFPFLAANLLDNRTGRPVEWPNVRPSVMVEAAGVRVGIVGVMTREALTATIPANVGGLTVAPLAHTMAAEASRLRARGAAVVVAAAHAGGRCADLTRPSDFSSCHDGSEIFGVVRALPPGLVDVVVAGHTHAGLAHRLAGTAVIEAFATGRAFGRVDLVVDRASGRVTDTRIFPPRDLCAREEPDGSCDTSPVPGPQSRQARYEGAPVEPDQAIARVLAPAIEEVRAVKARPLGVHIDTPIRRIRGTHAPLGNLFTDAIRGSIPGADAALHNTTGGLRADLPRGPLVYGSVYEVMPFDNKVVPLRLTGAQVRRVIAHHLGRTRRVLSVSGLLVRAACSGGEVAVTLLRPSGAPVRDDEVLTVVVSDFLALGGDGILTPVMPEGGFGVPGEAPLARDVLAQYLQARGGSLREDQLFEASSPRIAFADTAALTACVA